MLTQAQYRDDGGEANDLVTEEVSDRRNRGYPCERAQEVENQNPSPRHGQNAGHWTSNYAKASNETSRFLVFADGVAALEFRLTTTVTSGLLFMLMVPNP